MMQVGGERRSGKEGQVGRLLYEETLFLWLSTALVGCFAAVFCSRAVYQILKWPGGDNSPPTWFFMLIGLLFLGIALNFRKLRIELSPQAVMVSYGIVQRTIPWEAIARCYRDEVSSIRYGGWGIRIGWVQGNWRLVYNTPGAPRVVLALKHGWFGEFVFSTKNPEEVMGIIRQRIGRWD
jgi:hypothetical protein